MISMVSIPHRQTQNFKITFAHFCGLLVSIPHRQTQNFILIFYHHILILCFNSSQVDSKPMSGISRAPGPQVSIPHRQTQNFNMASSSDLLPGVSIPHRQTQNYILIISQLFLYCVSIPHRQTQNVLDFPCLGGILTSFNSSQVDSKRQ